MIKTRAIRIQLYWEIGFHVFNFVHTLGFIELKLLELYSVNVEFERHAQIKHLTKKAGADRVYTVNIQDTALTLVNTHNSRLFTHYLTHGTPPANGPLNRLDSIVASTASITSYLVDLLLPLLATEATKRQSISTQRYATITP